MRTSSIIRAQVILLFAGAAVFGVVSPRNPAAVLVVGLMIAAWALVQHLRQRRHA